MTNENQSSDGVFELKVLSVINVESGVGIYVTVDERRTPVVVATPDKTARFIVSPATTFVFHGKGGHTKGQKIIRFPSPLHVCQRLNLSFHFFCLSSCSFIHNQQLRVFRKRRKQTDEKWWKRIKTKDVCLGRATIDFRDFIPRPCSTVLVQLTKVVCI